MDPRLLRGDDEKLASATFYDAIKKGSWILSSCLG
jgi:hypothetical protein